MSDIQAEESERAAFVPRLRQRGARDEVVLRAIEMVPRALFVDPALRQHAYDDVALPIACGQTMSQPSVVVEMTEALTVNATHRVLEVGTGSGYQAAVLANLAAEVVTVDRYRTLVTEAQARFQVLGLRNVTALVADGRAGAPSRAPFDRIIVTASVREVPQALFDQLRPDGILVAPVGDPASVQHIVRYAKAPSGVTPTTLSPVRFVPLLEGVSVTL